MNVQTIRLGELCRTTSGGTPSREDASYYGGGIAWVKSGELNDGVVSKTQERITSRGLENSNAEVFPAGTLLIALYGATVGKLGVLGMDAATNQAICAIFPTDRLNKEYLRFYLLSRRSQLIRQRTGGAQPNISQDIIRNLLVPIPALSAQQQIAKQLEKADRLRRTRRYALELSDTIPPAAFLQLFGNGAKIFPVSTVNDLLADKSHAIRTGPFGSQLLHSEFTDHGIAVLGIDNAVKNQFEWAERRFIMPKKYEHLKRYTVFPGDVIITLMGTCGRCAVVPNGIPTAINTKHLCCITLDQKRCLPLFLQGAFLYHPSVRYQLARATKGSIMEGLNMGIIQKLLIPVPPPSMQQQFANLVTRHERLRVALRESLRQAEHLFQTLLHRAFANDA